LNSSCPVLALPVRNPSSRNQAFSGIEFVLVRIVVPAELANRSFPVDVTSIDPQDTPLAVAFHNRTLDAGLAV